MEPVQVAVTRPAAEREAGEAERLSDGGAAAVKAMVLEMEIKL